MTTAASLNTAHLDEVLKQSFDYIICGGGTAGLCVAARLSEDPNVSVLVLEAGDANLNDPAILQTGSFGSHFGNPKYSWMYKTVPQKFADGHEYFWPRGKGLGGSSAVNFLCWTKPHASEFSDWEKLGISGWDWSTFQHYCRRVESFVHPTMDKQNKHRLVVEGWTTGTDGPLTMAFPGNIPAAELDIQQTLINCGLPVSTKPLDGDPTGVFFAPCTIDPKTHSRTYAVTAYYLPAAHRQNLVVLCNAMVSRIVTVDDAAGLVGTAVQFQCNGRDSSVSANKEIIVSAGALKSPQILELSGIGDRAVLSNLGIPIKLDLPVGKNVQEHIVCGLSFELNEKASFETWNLLLDPEVAAKHLELYASGAGMYAMSVISFAMVGARALCGDGRFKEICASIREKIAQNAAKYPPGLLEQMEIQVQRLENEMPGCEIISAPGFISGPNPAEPKKSYVSIQAGLNHCFSRGTIHAVSSDPSVEPALDPHYFEESVDMDILLEIVKFIRKLPQSEPFKSMIVREVNPGPEVVSDEQLAEWAKTTLLTTFHTVGSASMLPKGKGGVVDDCLKVYGTRNIRVVDVSVLPLHIGAHTQAAAYVIAERAADIIKGVA